MEMWDVYLIISPELSDAGSIPGSSDIQRSKQNHNYTFFSSAFLSDYPESFLTRQSTFQFDTLCTVSFLRLFTVDSFDSLQSFLSVFLLGQCRCSQELRSLEFSIAPGDT